MSFKGVHQRKPIQSWITTIHASELQDDPKTVQSGAEQTRTLETHTLITAQPETRKTLADTGPCLPRQGGAPPPSPTLLAGFLTGF